MGRCGTAPGGRGGAEKGGGAPGGPAHREGRSRGIKRVRGGGCGDGRGMAALGALVKKAWSVRRFVVLLCAPLVLVPILLSLPPKVPRTGPRVGTAGWGHRRRHTAGHRVGTRSGRTNRGRCLGTKSMERRYTLGAVGLGQGTQPGCDTSVTPLASASAAFGSREGHPATCQGWTMEARDSRVWVINLLQQLKLRMEGASCGHVGFIGGRRDR